MTNTTEQKKEKQTFARGFSGGYNQQSVSEVLSYEECFFRDNEISRIIETIGKANNGNIMIIGKEGVGKTNLVKGATKKIKDILNKEVIELNPHFLFHLINSKAQFDERLINILNNISMSDNKVLFIDNFDMFFKEYKGVDFNFDLILSTFLEKNAINCILNIDDKNFDIFNNSYIGKFFDKLYINELSKEQSINVVKEKISAFSNHYGINVEDQTIELTYNLTERFIPGIKNPKISFNVIESALSYYRLSGTINLTDEQTQKITFFQDEIKKTIMNKNEAVKRGDILMANMLRKAELRITNELTTYQNSLNLGEYEPNLTNDSIKYVISNISKVPISDLNVTQLEKLKRLESNLNQKIINQESAIKQISKAIKRNAMGIRDSSKPIGVFLFVGPTGTGKTYLTKVLANSYYTNEQDIIRLDMSEYADKTSVNKLFGSAPGYIGYDDGGILTSHVSKKPYSIILLDEIEKAHTSIFNALLQVFDSGQMTDNKGNKVSFKNTIIIMTSNIGCHRAAQKIEYKPRAVGFGYKPAENIANQNEQGFRYEIKSAIKETFTPEFINRIDETVIFNHLSLEDLHKIIKLELEQIRERIYENNVLDKVNFSNNIIPNIMKSNQNNINLDYGAREIKRLLNDFEDAIADYVLENESKRVTINYLRNKYVIKAI